MRVARIKNPVYNKTINPTFNKAINPTFNRAINPTFNRTINPTFNRTINPTFNRTINPIFNRKVNPTFNRTINPTFNMTINPSFNRTINPSFNPNFDGFILFSLDTEPTYFVVACEKVLIFFNDANEMKLLAIEHINNGFVLYDSQLHLIGHLESNSQNGYNQFDMSNSWLGYLVK